MRVVYNGIDLNVLETYEFVAEPVYDDTQTDYLYTRYSITVRAIINGQADIDSGFGAGGRAWRNGPVMTYARNGVLVVPATNNLPGPPAFVNTYPGFRNVPPGPGNDRPNPYVPFVPGLVGGRPAPGTGPGSEPGTSLPATPRLFSVVPTAPTNTATTHDAIRYRLTTPRGQLFIFAGPQDGAALVEMMLASPTRAVPGGTAPPCDAKNGPIPRLLAVHQAFGDATTLLVDFSVETYVNENEQNGTNTNNADRTAGLLSNRFTQSNEITKDGFTNILTEGTAIFRTDRLYTLATNPDAIRDSLFMPIPLGFCREAIRVTGLSDTTGVRYSYVDIQQPVNYPAGQAVHSSSISAVHRQAMVTGDVLKGALNAYERFLGIRANKHFGDSSKDNVKNPRPPEANEPYSPPPGP